jgi:small subunit ribosomal protein S16
MSVKIRLQRHGKKGKPFYWIVAADARSKRDGRLLEKLGTYNPNTNPATINLDIDGAVKWLQNGAQPTDTARAILSYKGAMLKNHLAGGVIKGALTEDQAEKKFDAWLEEKSSKISAKADGLAKAKADAEAKALEIEKEINEKRKTDALEAENAAVKAEADAKIKAEVKETEEEAPQTIDDAVEAASEAIAKKVVPEEEVKAETEVEVEVEAEVKEEVEAEVKAETETEVEAKVEKEVEVKAEAETEVEKETPAKDKPSKEEE